MKKTIVLLAALAVLGCSGKKQGEKLTSAPAPGQTAKTAAAAPLAGKPDNSDLEGGYEVALVELTEVVRSKRYWYHVVVKKPFSKEQLERLADVVYEKARKETPFNALTVGFYDQPQFIGHGFRWGPVDYAPGGEIANASKVKTGDYSTMQKVSRVKEPNWQNALTPREAQMIVDFGEAAAKFEDNATTGEELDAAEEKATKEVAKKYGITPKEFDAVWLKYAVNVLD